ncbi:CamS family sex pheromone protein [Caldifermentibacillus hisashii]|uniref:CamS family sex pheromone protein n=1 Tax=Caldifermentibacillus hisashii TaxID=996558 RepID=UPI003D1ED2D0
MRKYMILSFLLVFVLSGCLPNVNDQDEVVKKNNKTEEKAIIPKYQISESYYRTLTPFKPSSVRGMVVSNLNNRFDSDEFEEGLLRISQRNFPTDTYIFQEGQYINKKTITGWLRRKMTSGQLQEKGLKENENIGLNPLLENEADQEKNPIYLAHILEHDYLVKSEGDTVKLGGVSIGLALNSVYYYKLDGAEKKVEIPNNVIESEGKRIAEELIGQLRKIKGLESVPITIGLFKQQDKTSIVPGNYFAYGTADSGTSLEWNKVEEEYVLFPSTDATEKHRDDAQQFDTFKNNVGQYFSNYNGIVGRALYINNELNKISIDVTMQFYGKTEVIGFSQYIASLIVESFPKYATTEVNVNSVPNQEALILKEPDMDEPFVHIY